jgi:hypothetical protein
MKRKLILNQNKMNAKLIKVNIHYYLWLNPESEEREYLGSSKFIDEEREPLKSKYKLSSTNCDSIARGYGREELINLAKISRTSISPLFKDKIDAKSHEDGFIAGFHEACKMMRGKNFTKIDMKKIFDLGVNAGVGAIQGKVNINFKKYLKSLQQTEWDVTFNPKERDGYGCLILKRIP